MKNKSIQNCSECQFENGEHSQECSEFVDKEKMWEKTQDKIKIQESKRPAVDKKTFYTDASFDWTSTEKSNENVVHGKIAIVGINFERIEKVAVGKVKGLKQYINVFELIAVARAVELANEEEPKVGALAIYTDSNVAKVWANNGAVNPKSATEAHESAIEYLRKARIQFGGTITFNFVPRNNNPAGKLLEVELEKESLNIK